MYGYLLKRIFLVSLISWIVAVPLCASNVKNGELNLSTIHLTTNFTLQGPWQYYPGDFLSARQMQELPEHDKKFVRLPSRWNNHRHYPEKLSNFGCMTYYLRIIVDPSVVGQVAGIKFYTVSSAYKVYVNNELLVTKGQPSRSEQGFESDRSAHLLHFTIETDTLHLVLHVSNFSLKNYGGVAQPIVFGSIEEIEKRNFVNYFETLFFSSAFFILLFLHLLIYLIRGREITHIQIALISVLFMLKILTENEHILLKFSSWMNLTIEYKLWNATLLIFPVLLNFTQRIFPDDIPRKIAYLAYTVFAIMLILIFFLPLQLLSSISHFLVLPPFIGIIYLFIVLIKAMIKKRKDALIYFAALFIMFLGFINDIFYVTDLYRTSLQAHIGGLVFLTIQTWIVISRYTRSYEQLALLKNELQNVNHNLESLIEKRTVELKTAVTQLEKANKNQDLILTTISHDLMNIFNNLRFFSNDLLHRHKLKPEIGTDLERINNNADNGLNILNNILEWRSAQENQRSKQVKILHLTKILKECIAQHSDLIALKSVNIKLEIDDSLHFWCDYTQLFTILRNLLSNALKFSNTNGTIIISNQISANRVTLSIQDYGIGMPDWITNNVFTLRKDKKREGTMGEKGSGIGLILTRDLVENNQGTIRIESQQGEWTRVSISFTAAIKE